MLSLLILLFNEMKHLRRFVCVKSVAKWSIKEMSLELYIVGKVYLFIGQIFVMENEAALI